MPDYAVSAGAIGSPAFSLTSNQISTITFADDLPEVEVISDGTAPIWWTCDGTNPAPGTGYYIPILGVDSRQPGTATGTIVKLISTGTPNVRVQRA